MYKSFNGKPINKEIKCLKFDNGSEYKSLDFVKLCLENDIMKQYIATYILEWVKEKTRH